MIYILMQVIDSAGNIGWQQFNEVSIDPSTIWAYLEGLSEGDGNHYLAQTISDDGLTATILAQV